MMTYGITNLPRTGNAHFSLSVLPPHGSETLRTGSEALPVGSKALQVVSEALQAGSKLLPAAIDQVELFDHNI